MPPADVPSPELIGGLSVEQYAGLTAALAEGFPPPEVLALEGLDDRAWRAASIGWRRRLAGDGPDGPIFLAYRDRLAVAEDWLARPVEPLDGDVAAWVGFCGAFSRHAAGFALLAGLGLGMNDLARLTRRWAKRMAEDEGVRKRAAELTRKEVAEAPSVRAGPAKLKPFPWSKGRAAPAPEPPQDAAEARLPAEEEEAFGLDRYAAVCAELALDPEGAERALARHEISRDELHAVEARYRARFAADPALDRSFRHLYGFYHARFGSARRAEPIAPRAVAERPRALPAVLPEPVFAGTSLSVVIPRGPALPFVAGQAPAAVAAGTPERAGEKRPPSGVGGTALVLDVPKGAALPFAARAARAEGAPAPEVLRPPDHLGGTAPMRDVPRGPSLPFAAGEAPPAIAKPSPADKRAPRPAGGTRPPGDAPQGPSLPFAKDRAGLPAVRRNPDKLAGRSLGMGMPQALPVPQPAPPSEAAAKPVAVEKPPDAAASWSPELTLEQHASLCVEIAMSPDRSAEALARYRLTPEAKARLDQRYREQVAAREEVRAAWNAAYQTYHAWLLANRGPR